MAGPGFAVLEFETTGILAGENDRVTEVAIVHLSPEGRVQGQWSTLVNPGELMGTHRFRPTSTPDNAPEFADIASDLVGLLDGRVVVAHHAGFQLRFLIAELTRAGHAVPHDGGSVLCTMQLARDFHPGATRSREGCRLAFGLDPRTTPATALPNALATADLLAAYIGSTDDRTFWDRYLGHALDDPWRSVTPVRSATPPSRWVARRGGDTAIVRETHPFLRRIARAMRSYTGNSDHLDYLAFLDRCLIEGYLAAGGALARLAQELNISRFTCESLHHDYFVELCSIAAQSGSLSEHQVGELWAVGELLDLPTSVIRSALDAPRPAGVPHLLAG
jgi:DNA polymerase-3 subunit epsilon